MSSKDLINLNDLKHPLIVIAQEFKHPKPLDIYLLPYTIEEVQDLETIPQRDPIEVVRLKLKHLREVYIGTVQLPFSALVMTHAGIPYFEGKIPSEIREAARSASLLPEHCETLDRVFGGDKPTRIGRLSEEASYEDLKKQLSIRDTFLRGEPGSRRGEGQDMVYSGWSFNFYGDRNNSIGVVFDPWFKNMGCNILHALWNHFKERFPEVPSSEIPNSTDPALESRMATYVGINTQGHTNFVRTVYDLFSQCFDLHLLQQPISGSRYGVIGTRKKPYQKESLESKVPRLIQG